MSKEVVTEWSGRNAQKDNLRAKTWRLLEEGKGTTSSPFGHIPNFIGAELAAARLAELPFWRDARVIKANPDAAQSPLRLRALQEGKRLYMAVPRLADAHPFVDLIAGELLAKGIQLEIAATHQGATKYGRLVFLEEMEPIDLVVVGCVAVTRSGGRTGKGAGFADLELGMLRECGLVHADTPLVTTVHPLQVVNNSELPMQAHDWTLDWIATPVEVIATNASHDRPEGLDWNAIQPDQLDSIPVLRMIRESKHTQFG